jgi:hypothetical protein
LAGAVPYFLVWVDLNDVTFIDQRGDLLLRAMSKEGAQFIANSLHIKHVLAGLK